VFDTSVPSTSVQTNLVMDIELLSVSRAARFIQYTLEHDLQVKVNRSTASSLLSSSIARPDEQHYLEFASEKFDKLMTFFAANDQQVHYASASNSVGVYANTRLLGELRRQIRDYHNAPVGANEGDYLRMMSPRGFGGDNTQRTARSESGGQPAFRLPTEEQLKSRFAEKGKAPVEVAQEQSKS